MWHPICDILKDVTKLEKPKEKRKSGKRKNSIRKLKMTEPFSTEIIQEGDYFEYVVKFFNHPVIGVGKNLKEGIKSAFSNLRAYLDFIEKENIQLKINKRKEVLAYMKDTHLKVEFYRALSKERILALGRIAYKYGLSTLYGEVDEKNESDFNRDLTIIQTALEELERIYRYKEK